MAKKQQKKAALVLEFENGTNPQGKALYKRVQFQGINSALDADSLLAIGTALGKIAAAKLNAVYTVDTNLVSA